MKKKIKKEIKIAKFQADVLRVCQKVKAGEMPIKEFDKKTKELFKNTNY